jgi:fucose 4-O-acetylase-like acetyltransferase
MLAQTLAQSDSSGLAGAGILIIIYIALFAIYLVSMWKLFTKMGQPGWVGIIPILNWYGIYKLAGREWWWVILLFIPCINIIALWFLASDTAKLFGKELGWTILLFLLPGIGHIILAFGDSQYVGPNEQVI